MSLPFITTTLSTIRNWLPSRESYSTVSEPKNMDQADKSKKVALSACAHCHQLLNSCSRSQIDHSKEINMDVWSVSILIETDNSMWAPLLSHHTFLIIEGFSTEGKFWQKAHLMGPGTSRDVKIMQDSYSGHSNHGEVKLTPKKHGYFDLSECKPNRQTWVASKEKVERMLLQIQWEQDHPEATPFRFLGEKSIVAVQREFLDTRHPELLKIERQDPVKFKKLCFLLKNKECVEDYVQWYSNKAPTVIKASNAYFTTYAIILPFVVLAFVNPGTRQIVSNYKNVFFGATITVYSALASMMFHLIHTKKKDKSLIDEVKKNEDQLSFIETRAKTTTAVSQNCFNWARKQLLIIDAVVPENQFENLIAIPEFSLPKDGAVIDCLTDK